MGSSNGGEAEDQAFIKAARRAASRCAGAGWPSGTSISLRLILPATVISRRASSITFTSSGTGGQKRHIALDQASFDRQALMRQRIIESQDLASSIPVNYLVFNCDPAIAPQVASRGA